MKYTANGTEEYIIRELAKFCDEECNITLIDRKNIEGQDAQLVWFECEGCLIVPAIVYADGTTFTVTDWQGIYDKDDFVIEDYDWMDCNKKRCIMFDGMPRMFM